MRGYPVHLLFHLLAVVAGIACGVGGGLWWFHDDRNALYLAVTALIVGIIVLLLQGLYISTSQPPRREPRRPMPPAPPSHPRFQPVAERREPTRPDLEPVAPPEAQADSVDQETKTSAIDALNEHTKG